MQLSLLAFGMVIAGFVVRGMARSFIGGRAGDLLAAPLVIGGFSLIVVLTVIAAVGLLGFGPLGDRVGDND